MRTQAGSTRTSLNTVTQKKRRRSNNYESANDPVEK
jgi:hypothetical protein